MYLTKGYLSNKTDLLDIKSIVVQGFLPHVFTLLPIN